MNTKLSLIVLATLAVGAVAMAQDGLVTTEFKAMTADEAVNRLAQISGQKLGASGTVKSEIVYLNVKNQPIEVVKTRLANLLGAEWRQEGENYYLARSGITEQRQRAAEIAARAERLKLELAKQIEANAKLAAFDAAEAQRLTSQFQTAIEGMRTGGGQGWRRMVDLSNQLPAGRTIVSVVAQMNINDLAAIPAGGRRVFSINPTRMQGQLPNGTLRMVSKMVQDQFLMEQTATQTFGEMASFMLNGGRQGPAPTGDVTSVLLVATRFGGGDTISLSLLAGNQVGLLMTSGAMALGIPAEQTPEVRTKVLGEGKPVSLSAESKELLAAMRSGAMGGGGMFVTGGSRAGGREESITVTAGAPSGSAPATASKPTALSPGLRAKLQNPADVDPLSFFVSDSLSSIAKEHDRNVIALLPDTAFSVLVNPLNQADAKTDAVISAFQSSDMAVSQADGWVTIEPKSPTAARERVDRAALGRLLAAMERSPILSLDQLANYFATAPSGGGMAFNGFESGYASALNAGTSFQQLMQTFGRDRDSLRFYGRLSTSQRMALRNGQSLQAAALSQPQREAADRLIFWSFDGPQLRQQQNQDDRREMRMMVMSGGPGMAFGMGTQDPKSERTTILAGGMPGNTVITMTGQKEEMVLARDANGRPTLLSIFALAANRAALSGQGMNVGGGMANFQMQGTQYEGYQVAGQTNYTLQFDLMPNYSLSRNLEEPLLDPNGRFVPYDQLPVALRNAVTEAARRMQGGGRGPGGGPGGERPRRP